MYPFSVSGLRVDALPHRVVVMDNPVSSNPQLYNLRLRYLLADTPSVLIERLDVLEDLRPGHCYKSGFYLLV